MGVLPGTTQSNLHSKREPLNEPRWLRWSITIQILVLILNINSVRWTDKISTIMLVGSLCLTTAGFIQHITKGK